MYAADKIPFLDLVTSHADLEKELTEVFIQVLRSAAFVGGPVVEAFERNFAEFCGTRYAIAVNSGTDALRFAIMACGVVPGDVVLTVPNTFIATTEAISQAGAIPEFIDIDEATFNMSAERLQRFLEEQCTRSRTGQLISKRHCKPVTAIVPVHLYGQVADMDAILCLAEKYGLTILEDACQAHGAQYYSSRSDRWLNAGSMGVAAAFSFYPGKNLGACGEGGAVTTNDASIAEKIKMLRDHGQSQKYYHKLEGYNGRLDSLQAGLLDVKLRYLSNWNERRRKLAATYNCLLADVSGVICPSEPSWSRAVYHLYVIRTEDRDNMISHMRDAGIGTGIHYPVPLHLQQAYIWLGYRLGDFPRTERAAGEILSFPMYPQLSAEQQSRVVKEICMFMSRSRRILPKSEHVISDEVARFV